LLSIWKPVWMMMTRVATIFLKFCRSTLSSKHLKSFVHWKLLVGLSKYWTKKSPKFQWNPIQILKLKARFLPPLDWFHGITDHCVSQFHADCQLLQTCKII
jgi:hypothetical protein